MGNASVIFFRPEPDTLARVHLSHRPTHLNSDDGTQEELRAWLSSRAFAPGEVSFKPRAVRSLTITLTSGYGEYGLSRITVHTPPQQ